MKKALITRVTGQDGSYLAEFLLSKGYEVHDIVRRASTFNTKRIDHIVVDHHDPSARFFFYYGDLSDSEQISNAIYNVKPDEETPFKPRSPYACPKVYAHLMTVNYREGYDMFACVCMQWHLI